MLADFPNTIHIALLWLCLTVKELCRQIHQYRREEDEDEEEQEESW